MTFLQQLVLVTFTDINCRFSTFGFFIYLFFSFQLWFLLFCRFLLTLILIVMEASQISCEFQSAPSHLRYFCGARLDSKLPRRLPVVQQRRPQRRDGQRPGRTHSQLRNPHEQTPLGISRQLNVSHVLSCRRRRSTGSIWASTASRSPTSPRPPTLPTYLVCWPWLRAMTQRTTPIKSKSALPQSKRFE